MEKSKWNIEKKKKEKKKQTLKQKDDSTVEPRYFQLSGETKNSSK